MEGFKDRYERECRRVGETPAVSVQRLIEKVHRLPDAHSLHIPHPNSHLLRILNLPFRMLSDFWPQGGSERKLTISRSIITTQQISCLARALANDAYFLELDFEDISLEVSEVRQLRHASPPFTQMSRFSRTME